MSKGKRRESKKLTVSEKRQIVWAAAIAIIIGILLFLHSQGVLF